MADGVAVAVKPAEKSRVLVYRPTRLQVAQADEVMNLFFLQGRVREQIQRLGGHARRLEVNQELGQFAVKRPAPGGELAVELLRGEFDQVVGWTALPDEAHFDDAEFFELLFFIEGVE